MFEMFLKKNTLSSKNNAFFLQKKSPVFLLSFIIANGHLKIQMLQFNINIINTVNKKKQYQHSGSYLPWYGVSMPYLWAGLSVLSTVLKKECQPWLHQSLWWKKICVLDIFHSWCGPIDRSINRLIAELHADRRMLTADSSQND